MRREPRPPWAGKLGEIDGVNVSSKRGHRERPTKNVGTHFSPLTLVKKKIFLVIGAVMTQDRTLALDDRERLTEIQDLLLEHIIEHKEAIAPWSRRTCENT